MMRAIKILGNVSTPEVVIDHSVPVPVPRNDQILVKVHAAGITGDELFWPELYTTESRIPGHEISGTISATGPDYHGPLAVGQDVIALIAADRAEGQAEYAICLADEVAPKPSSLSHEEAAALPIPFLTAWEALIDHAKVKSGTRVLITGASGAVGSIAVQLAAHLTGCHVTALASSHHHDALKSLGAQEVVDYNSPHWEQQIQDMEIVIDMVGGDIMTRSWETVINDGFIITVADPPPPWAFERAVAAQSLNFPAVRYKYFIVSPSSERLAQLSGMIRDCVVTALAVTSFPANEAEQAWAHARQRNHGSKAVVNFG